jgi:hypothetical protein
VVSRLIGGRFIKRYSDSVTGLVFRNHSLDVLHFDILFYSALTCSLEKDKLTTVLVPLALFPLVEVRSTVRQSQGSTERSRDTIGERHRLGKSAGGGTSTVPKYTHVPRATDREIPWYTN